MNTKLFLVLLSAALIGVGCVKTVTGRTTGAVPFVRDSVMGFYERSVDQVFNASVEVIKFNGTLSTESTLFSQTNQVKTVEGKVNQRKVWIRVEAQNPKITSVEVQVRTKAGGKDMNLAHELEKQIALKMVK